VPVLTVKIETRHRARLVKRCENRGGASTRSPRYMPSPTNVLAFMTYNFYS
jgi:hypothetical protein